MRPLHSPGRVDPDDVQVAEVDALFVLPAAARAAFGPDVASVLSRRRRLLRQRETATWKRQRSRGSRLPLQDPFKTGFEPRTIKGASEVRKSLTLLQGEAEEEEGEECAREGRHAHPLMVCCVEAAADLQVPSAGALTAYTGPCR